MLNVPLRVVQSTRSNELPDPGARLQGTVALSSNLALADEASRQQAATVVGGGISGAEALQTALARQLSDALARSTALPLRRRKAPSRLSKCRPALRRATSGPWQWKQASDRMGNTSRPKSTCADIPVSLPG